MNNQGFWRNAKVKFYLNKERLFKDIMELDQKKSLSEEEAEEMLKEDIEDFKQTVRDEKLRKEDLKQLYSLEKSGKERNSFLNFLVRYGKEDKVLRELDGFLNQASRIDSALERIVEDGSQDLDLDKISSKTVKELKKYIDEQYLTKEELKIILENEEESKDRKTAKRYIKRELDNSSSIISPSEVQKDISGVEDKVKSFKKDFIYHPEVFDLDNIEKEFNEHYENQEKENNLEDLVKLTGTLAENLKNSDSLENREEMKQLINDSILALEADNLDKFKEKIEKLNEISEPEKESSNEKAKSQQSKLKEVEEVINRLEDAGYGEQSRETSDSQESEPEGRKSDSSRAKLVSKLEEKGFNKEKLETRSGSDLKKLEESSEKIDEVEEMFSKKAEKEKDNERTSENRIIRDIEKLEETIEKSE